MSELGGYCAEHGRWGGRAETAPCPYCAYPDSSWNPLRKTLPSHYNPEFPVNYFQYLASEAGSLSQSRLRGWWRLTRALLPSVYKVEDGTWVLDGPSWKTRTCDSGEWWCLFMVERTTDGWEFLGVHR